MPQWTSTVRLASGVVLSLALTFLLAPSAAAAPAADGASTIGSVADRARSTTEPTISIAFDAAAGETPAATADPERAAELRALALIADARAAAGVPPLQADDALGSIARSRATDMRDRHYFAHVSPDGGTVFDMLDAARVAWSSGAEVIGWNNEPSADASAARVVTAWLASASHREDLLAVGADHIGLASSYDPSSGRRTWAAVLIVSADRTPPIASVRVVSIGKRDATGHRRATIAWIARDAAVGGITSGIRDVTVQVRIAGGQWRTVAPGTTSSSLRLVVRAGQAVAVRVRPRDRAGNLGTWATVAFTP